MPIIWKRLSFDHYPGDFWKDWDNLNDRYYNGHPMLHSNFVSQLIVYFPPEKGLEVLAGRQGDDCVALFLLESPRTGISVAYRPSQTQIALALISPARKFSLRDMVATLPPTIARLDFFALDSKYHASLIKPASLHLQLSATTIVIDIDRSFSDYWLKRPENLRKNINRYMNRLEKEGKAIRLQVTSSAGEMRQAVARYGFMESRGWKGRSRTSLHPGNTQGNFYREIMTRFASRNSAKVFELFLDQKLVASRLCIYNRDQLIILKTTYDEEYKKYGVRRLLQYKTVRHIFEENTSSIVDFHTNASRDQLDWSTRCRGIYQISIYRSIAGIVLDLSEKTQKLLGRVCQKRTGLSD